MEWLTAFLEKHMTKSVFLTLLTSMVQVVNNVFPNSNGVADETLRQLIASSSGLQLTMLLILYLYLKLNHK